MPNLLDIRRRIKSVKNTQQITKAMKMVSAAKLKRAQDRVVTARPFANKMMEVLGELANRTDEDFHHPLLDLRGDERYLLILITADKGLCGAFNTNLTKAAQSFIKENSEKVIRSIVKTYSEDKEIDKVFLIYNEFKSVLQQRVVLEQLLPVSRTKGQEEETKSQPLTLVDYIYEQPPAEIFSRLLPRLIETQIFRALLESVASEQGARMTAMDSASKNASELIDSLTLNMNRVRQAAITNEIIEVVSGAAAQ